jgi:penicillin V acylase-like amidase (Ntn superfamily)
MGLMAVPSAEPPYDPEKVTLSDLALIRLVLDYATNTDDAVDLLRGYNYGATETPVHFLIADQSGAAALVEYVAGEMKVTRAA